MDLIEKLRGGCVVRPKRWSGDTHDDLGGSIDEGATNALMAEAAAALEAAREDGWQPIETAPRDGRQMILLLTPSRFPQVAFSNTWWTAGFSVECKPTHWRRIEPLPAIDQERGKGANDEA